MFGTNKSQVSDTETIFCIGDLVTISSEPEGYRLTGLDSVNDIIMSYFAINAESEGCDDVFDRAAETGKPISNDIEMWGLQIGKPYIVEDIFVFPNMLIENEPVTDNEPACIVVIRPLTEHMDDYKKMPKYILPYWMIDNYIDPEQ